MPGKRRTPAEIKADIEARKKAIDDKHRAAAAKLNAKLATVTAREKNQERKEDAHLKIVMGAAVQAHARIDPAFRAQLRVALNLAVVKDRDKALVQAWFEGLGTGQSTSEAA